MKRISLLTILVIAFFSSCASMGGGSADSSANMSTMKPASTAEDAESIAMPVSQKEAANMAPADGRLNRQTATRAPIATNIPLGKAEETYTAERKIIRNAELSLEAENPEDAQRKITSIAELRGGFVVESQQSGSEIQSTVRDIVAMTVRVPEDKFGDTLADIRNVSTRVVLENVKGQDVTEEFIDIEAQIKAKKALEDQFMEIMKRANTVPDALDVQRQLADVRGEIERIEGRKRFLANQSAMSTIKVRVQTAKVFAATSVGFGGRLAESFFAGAEVAMAMVLGLVTFLVAMLPIAIFIGLPVFVFIRYVWKRQSRPSSLIDMAEE